MTRARRLGLLLIVAGILMLLVAPHAQSCVTDFDATVCEVTGTVILKVVGVLVVAVAAIVLARGGGSAAGSRDDTR
jgi:hypothetical protein